MNNKEGVSTFLNFINLEMDYLHKTIVRPPTKEILDRVDERDRKICMGEWDGPETPYVKFIKEFYKNRDWSKK